MSRARRWLSNALATLYALAMYAFVFLPVGVLVLFSFQGGRFPILPFDGPSLKWYRAVLEDDDLVEATLNSLGVALVSSSLALVLGFLAAHGLARHRLPAKGLQRALLTAPLTVSYLIIGLGLLLLFNTLGVGRSLATVGIGHAVINAPLCFAILYSQMGDHQANVERAARDLGASAWQTLRLVSVPMLAPAILASFFLSMTFSWDEFIIAFLLSRFEVTLPVEIWGMLRSGLNPRTNAAGSLVFLVTLALLVVAELVAWLRGARSREGRRP